MVNRLTILIILSIPFGLNAQSFDSLTNKLSKTNSIDLGLNDELDSILLHSSKQYSVLNQSYDSTITSVGTSIERLYLKIDSLKKLGLNTDRLTPKLDSLTKWKDERMSFLTSKIENLKSSLNEGLDRLNLPPVLQEKAEKLISVMNKQDVSLPNTNLPVSFQNLDIGIPNVRDALIEQGLPNIGIPNATNLLDGQRLQEVTNIDIPSVDVGDAGNQVKGYQSQISELPKDIDGVAKLAEQQATNILAVTDVQKELGQVDKITDMASTLQDQEKLNRELAKEVQQQAVDHFAGKKEQLDKAMQSISKYKQKFPTITSLNDLPKKAPNEMKGKPFIERIVPGIAMQLQKKDDDLLADFNLYLGYRFTKRFTSGGGWNQRIGYNTDKYKWSSNNARIYGPRVFSEYKLGKGFSPRVEVEVMNTFVPPFIKKAPVDPGGREWVWGAFVGMKKDYTLYKKIKGTAMVMLRLFDPERKSPYADVVNARFGFEFPMKKKVRSHP